MISDLKSQISDRFLRVGRNDGPAIGYSGNLILGVF